MAGLLPRLLVEFLRNESPFSDSCPLPHSDSTHDKVAVIRCAHVGIDQADPEQVKCHRFLIHINYGQRLMYSRNQSTQRLKYLVLLVVALGITLALPTLARVLDRKPAAAVPVPQTESWWSARHEHALARIRQGEVDLLLIGDSITRGWADEGRRIWDAYYGRRRAVNLGFNGDRTEHVLWRLDHGEIDGIDPKLVIVMIGTNNTGARHDPPEETAAGIQAILTTLRTRLPGTKILLLGVFPRSASADDPLRR